jgi:hypothetical protein
MKEFPSVLWALCMTLSQATGHTPFSLVYGSEAMLPIEVGHKCFWVQQYSKEQSNDFLVDDLTKLEELREVAVIQSVKHQQAIGDIIHATSKLGILSYEKSKQLKSGTSFPPFEKGHLK